MGDMRLKELQEKLEASRVARDTARDACCAARDDYIKTRDAKDDYIKTRVIDLDAIINAEKAAYVVYDKATDAALIASCDFADAVEKYVSERLKNNEDKP